MADMYYQKIIRKSVMLFFVLALLLIPAIPKARVYAKEADIAIVSVPALNLRSGPGLDYKVLRILPQGERVSIFDRSNDDQWAEVQLEDGAQGWVYNQYISPLGDSDSQVLLEGLKLRAGPGFGYRTIRQLSKGQELDLVGRSLQRDWLLARLPDGKSGWVFAAYILTDANLAYLPVSEASGGPDGSGPPEPKNQVLVAIQNDLAVVDLSGFPTSEEISVYLGLPGNPADSRVASGTTSANGSARLTFTIPNEWSNGKAITQDNLLLQVRATDSSANITIPLVYIRY
jgi:uncharacterized protein YgiM (DUF1202 family)